MKHEHRNSFKKNFDEEIFSMMEIMRQGWFDIMHMPYSDMLDILKRKSEIEEDKLKKIKERMRVHKKRK